MKHPKLVGMSCKNTRFIKRGLTDGENVRMIKANSNDKERWNMLFQKNVWREVK